MSAQDLTPEELIAEIKRCGENPRCRCQRGQTYLAYDRDGSTWRCRGCLKAVAGCTCP